jgi:hypothetical protein
MCGIMFVWFAHYCKQHFPGQAQNIVQDRRALLHRHLAVAHGVELSQAHLIICSISVGASKIFFCNITGLRDRVSSIFPIQTIQDQD